jgi:hypothetical protein
VVVPVFTLISNGLQPLVPLEVQLSLRLALEKLLVLLWIATQLYHGHSTRLHMVVRVPANGVHKCTKLAVALSTYIYHI